MTQQNNIQLYKTAAELTTAAAEFICKTALSAVEKTGRFSLVLSGGNTPKRLYELLAKAPYKDRMPWKDTFIFWGDERCVPLEDKDNNARMAIDALLSKIDIPVGNICRIQSDLSPNDAAASYEQLIKKFFGDEVAKFDLVLLGIGDNGHTASLFPGTDVLQERTRWVKEVYVAEVNMYRITMTLPLINQASNLLFLVEGKGKAEIISKLFADTQQNPYPAQLVAPIDGKLYWFLDSEAASLLPNIHH